MAGTFRIPPLKRITERNTLAMHAQLAQFAVSSYCTIQNMILVCSPYLPFRGTSALNHM